LFNTETKDAFDYGQLSKAFFICVICDLNLSCSSSLEMSLTLYLLRHGQTALSRMMSSAVRVDPELTRRFADAKPLPPLIARNLARNLFQRLRRAIDTAQPLCDALESRCRCGLS